MGGRHESWGVCPQEGELQMEQSLSWQERGNRKIQNQNPSVTCVWCIWLEQTPSHPSTSQPHPTTGVPSKNHVVVTTVSAARLSGSPETLLGNPYYIPETFLPKV